VGSSTRLVLKLLLFTLLRVAPGWIVSFYWYQWLTMNIIVFCVNNWNDIYGFTVINFSIFLLHGLSRHDTLPLAGALVTESSNETTYFAQFLSLKAHGD
jgi:hypothetical protein